MKKPNQDLFCGQCLRGNCKKCNVTWCTCRKAGHPGPK